MGNNTDKQLYRGTIRLLAGNKEDEIIYNYLQTLPSGAKNKLFKEALIDYISREVNSAKSETNMESKLDSILKEIKDAEKRLTKAINDRTFEKTTSDTSSASTSHSEISSTEPVPKEEDSIPDNALDFLKNLNQGAKF